MELLTNHLNYYCFEKYVRKKVIKAPHPNPPKEIKSVRIPLL